MGETSSRSFSKFRWQAIYRKTVFQVKDPRGQLVSFTAESVEECPFLKQKKFSIITAFNPMNKQVSELKNHQQNNLLEADLKTGKWFFYKTRGELNGHREESFTVENISEEDAVFLGKKYRQHAILYNDSRGVRFVLC